MTGAAVVSRLRAEGWTIKTQDSLQVKLTKGERVVIVPLHDGKPLSDGLLSAIERQTGVKLGST
jgi:predicted RNA binding protein YcfA (HicA-like mRNA interferase family)